ncbi:cytochrome P450 family protein [Massilia endophytica]|uniref:cytochrome P450 n=1 Tax=Massilia endophytica TaxID=2899220 RepID=UPI001E310421|nr:cytochrome P450 [Massilia endophytica]UGQ47176.1 cytochrome P450 [Massilia endophytica]
MQYIPPADALAAPTHPDPYPWYAELAKQERLVRDERLGLWLAAAPALVREVMSHAACRVRPVKEPVPAAIAGSAGELFGRLARMNDGEKHASARQAVQARIAALGADGVAQRARAIAARMQPGAGDVAALNRYMDEVPVRVIASLLGFGDEELEQVAAQVRSFVACLSPLSSAEQIEGSHGAARMLMSAMERMEDGSAEMLANLVGLMSQTYEATAGLLGNSIIARWRQPDGEPAQLVRDTVRLDPSIHNTRRFVAEDAELGGVRVAAGEAILVVLGAAGMTFGHGVHRCPGRELAETITVAALEELGLAPAHLAWHYRRSLNARIPVFTEVA